MLTDVILVISCGYEDKTDWGKKVRPGTPSVNLSERQMVERCGASICVALMCRRVSTHA